MKKWIFTLIFVYVLINISQAQTTIVDPADYVSGGLSDGWSVDTIDGELYFKVVVDGYNTGFWDMPVTTSWDGTAVLCDTKYALGSESDSADLSKYKSVVQLSVSGSSGSIAMPSEPATSSFSSVSVDIPDDCDTIKYVQVYGQYMGGDYPATTGDTIWFSAIVTNGNSSGEPGILFNPATYPESMLTDGLEIVVEGTDTLLKVTTSGWDINLSLPTTYSMLDSNTITFDIKVDAGTSGLALDALNWFIGGNNPDGDQVFTGGEGATDYSSLKEISIYTGAEIEVSSLQFAAQQNSGSWDAQDGVVLYIGKIVTSQETTKNYEPRVTYTVPYTFGETIEFDGLQLEDAWLESDKALVDQVVDLDVGDYPASDADNSASWYALYDEDYLYIYADITDDNIVVMSDPESDDAQPWMNDGIELFFDIKDRRYDLDRISAEQHQLRYNINRKDDDGNLTADTSALGSEYLSTWAEVKGATTYQFEIAIPWGGIAQGAVDSVDIPAYITDSIKPGKKISFEISVIDADEEDGRQSILNWSNDTGEDQAYSTSLYWGQLILGANSAIRKTNTLTASIYPNPANETLKIAMEGMTQVIIYNVAGQQVMVQNNHNDSATLNVSDLTAGLYIVEVRSAKGSAIQKVTIK